jgi:hypothetical protein
MRSRHIEGFDSTLTAKAVLRNPGIERIRSQRFLAREQAKILVSYEQVQVSAHTADTAVAPCGLDILWRIDLELHAATMTATAMSRHDDSFLQTAI